MSQDLRSFLAAVERDHPQHLHRVRREVAQDFELAAIQQRLARDGRNPVCVFERVAGHEMTVVSNLFGSYELLGLALGEPQRDRTLARFIELMRQPRPTVPVAPGNAPCQEVVALGPEADLSRLPIPHHAEKDSGRYVTIGFMICRDPESGTINAGVYRHEVKGPRRLGCMINPGNHGAYILRRCRELGRALEVALVIGHHPAVVLGSLCRGPLEMNELEAMGALLGEGLEVVPARTVDLPVPARAEVVIEGVIDPSHVEPDGPFAEYTGYYGPPKDVPVIEVTAITQRRDALFHDLDPAHREHNLSGILGREAQILQRVREVVPSVQAVHLPPSGASVFHVYVRLAQRVPGEARFAGMAALMANFQLKHAVVVDDDIDIFDDQQVLWALATRFEADRDLTVMPNTLGAHLDPTAYGEERLAEGPMTTKMVLDATRWVSRPFAERVGLPADVLRRVDELGIV